MIFFNYIVYVSSNQILINLILKIQKELLIGDEKTKIQSVNFFVHYNIFDASRS